MKLIFIYLISLFYLFLEVFMEKFNLDNQRRVPGTGKHNCHPQISY